MERSNRLRIVTGALSRLMKAVLTGRKDDIREPPPDWERKRAFQLLLLVSQGKVRENLDTGRLKSLNPLVCDGLLVTSSRFSGERFFTLTGKTSLPILLGESRLATLLCWEAHEEDHRRDIHGILARTRRHVWLVNGRKTAKFVSRSCTFCRRIARKMVQQQMSRLPPQVLEPSPPFYNCSLDLFGPLITQGLGG